VAPQTFERYAHLGGAGAVANLIAAREAGLLGPGALCVMYAQGAGFTRAAAAVRF
jgi:3-oxoacyl-[acyl-carrier-protein] synthase III